MNRAERRAELERAKAKAKRKLQIDGAPTTPKQVGRSAAMHGTCPCWMCTTPALKHRRPKED